MQWKLSISKRMSNCGQLVICWVVKKSVWIRHQSQDSSLDLNPKPKYFPHTSLPPTLTQQNEIPQRKSHQEMPRMFKSALSKGKRPQLRARG